MSGEIFPWPEFHYDQVYFETNAAVLQAISSVELDALVGYLKNTLNAQILIEGHTDNTGTSAQNNLLSLQRANAIANYLQQKGIAANRIQRKGLGASMPIADNNTSAGRAQNRRTGFTIILK
jgi:outer membrane protein OmpA-like peptidoglycan-associated protein